MFAFFRDYWNEFISSEGGFSLLLMDGLLLVPLIMAAFFYPLQVLIAVGVLGILTVAVYQAHVLWRRHHHPPRIKALTAL